MNKITVGFLCTCTSPYCTGHPRTGAFSYALGEAFNLCQGDITLDFLLDDFPCGKMHFNLVPSLYSQLLDYTENNQTDIRLVCFQKKARRTFPDEKKHILQGFSHATRHHDHPFAGIGAAQEKGPEKRREFARDFSDQDIMDLQVFSTFMDRFSEERPRLAELIKKGRQFGKRLEIRTSISTCNASHTIIRFTGTPETGAD
jgi:hypothetical protein